MLLSVVIKIFPVYIQSMIDSVSLERNLPYPKGELKITTLTTIKTSGMKIPSTGIIDISIIYNISISVMLL